MQRHLCLIYCHCTSAVMSVECVYQRRPLQGDYRDASSQYFTCGTPIGKSSPLTFNRSEFYVVKIDRNGGFRLHNTWKTFWWPGCNGPSGLRELTGHVRQCYRCVNVTGVYGCERPADGQWRMLALLVVFFSFSVIFYASLPLLPCVDVWLSTGDETVEKLIHRGGNGVGV